VLSLSSYLVKASRDECPYVAVSVFLSRAFRHTSIYVRTDRIKRPEDLRGCRIGIPEYQLTAIVWARALLEDDYGVKASDVTWVRGGIDEPGRPEKIKLELPSDIRLESAPDGDAISAMLDREDIDAFIAPRPPGCADSNSNVGGLFPDPSAVAKDYYRRVDVFPIMHVLGIRRTLAESHPWLPAAVLKAFEQSKAMALAKLADTSATKVTLPFVEEQLKGARELMGQDYWSDDVEADRLTFETFVHRHHGQSLAARRGVVEEPFHPGRGVSEEQQQVGLFRPCRRLLLRANA